jgi:hypothetical protein
VAWSVKVTEEYAAWFTALIKDDLASATSRSCGPAPEAGPRSGCSSRSTRRPALLLLGGDKAGNWQRWYRENIPIAERLYLEYTAEKQE